jgi:hypothetical protein
MSEPTFPVSFRDPVYAAADQAASDAAGIPPGLLQSIRLAGEKSNANQVSSAGAQTPYQVTPATRDLLIKKYKIDPYASPEAAALGAAYLLKEGIQRTGSAAGAVTQYIGGTDPANWGGQTRAYTNRVMSHFTNGGGQDAPQAAPAAPLPSPASYGLDPSVVGTDTAPQQTPTQTVTPSAPALAPGAGVTAQIVADYNSGRLSPQDMDAVDARVKAGKIAVDPTQLVRPSPPTADSNAGGAPTPNQGVSPPAAKPIGPQTLAALQAGTLAPDQLAIVKQGLADGSLVMPTVPQQPQGSDTGSMAGLLAGSTGLPASAMPTAPQNPTTAAQNGSTISDIAEKGVGGIAGSLLDIAAAGGRMVGANDFANQAVDARNQINEKIARDTSGSVAGKIAGAVGSAVPYVAAGGASLPTAVAGGAVAGATPAIADNKSAAEIARDAAVGAGAGAAGFGVGKALGAGISALAENPTIAKGIAKAQSWFGKSPSAATQAAAAGGATDARVAAEIAQASGNTPEQLATKLESAPAPKTPGYTPTAAEMANDANLTTVQKAATNANPSEFANASAANDEAIARQLAQQGTPANPGAPANPQVVEQAAETAAQRSDALAAQGQAEVKPLATDVAQKLQTPQFEAPVKLAQRMARDEGSTVFDDLQKARQADAGNTLEQIIGTPEQLDTMKAARSTQASQDLKKIFQGAKAANPAPVLNTIDSILAGPSGKRPAVAQSLNSLRNIIDNDGAPITDAKTLYDSVRKGIDDMVDPKMATANPAGVQASRELLRVKEVLDKQLEKSAPGFQNYLDNFKQASAPIDAMQSVQSRLYSAVDPVSGEVDPGKLVSAINSVKTEQMKPGARAADKVPQDTLDALTELARHLQNKNDLTGLAPEGQEYIRRALASSDKHAAAQAEFRKVLDTQSPSYKELHGAHAQNVATIESARMSQAALAQAQEAIQNADSPAGLRSLDKILPDMEAADRAKAIALRQARARELAMSEAQERNLNAAGKTEFNRGTFKTIADKYTPYMSVSDAARFSNVSDDLLKQTASYAKTGKISGSDTAQNQSAARRFGSNLGSALKDSAVQGLITGGVGSAFGPVGAVGGMAAGAITGALTRTVTQKVSSITTENAAKLLSNGKLLASALRNYQSLAARQLFVQQLAAKVGFVGGAAAANQFNSRR